MSFSAAKHTKAYPRCRGPFHQHLHTYMFVGAYHNYDVQYLLGWPYLAANLTYQKLTSITLDRPYSDLDRNISNGTMQMWKDFAKTG